MKIDLSVASLFFALALLAFLLALAFGGRTNSVLLELGLAFVALGLLVRT